MDCALMIFMNFKKRVARQCGRQTAAKGKWG
jgi:hypothetical protein